MRTFKLLVCLILFSFLFQLCSTQSRTVVENKDCEMSTKVTNLRCSKCKTARIEGLFEGDKQVKTRAGCYECYSGFASSSYKEITLPENLPDGFNFGDYCNFLPAWGWYTLIGLVLVASGVIFYLLKTKTRCCTKKSRDYDESLNGDSR